MKNIALSTLTVASLLLAPVALRADGTKECCPAGGKQTSAAAAKPCGEKAGAACCEKAGGACCEKTAAACTEKTAATCTEKTAATCTAKTAGAAGEQTKAATLTKVQYHVDGMTCGGCEAKVTKALQEIQGVGEVSASSESKLVKLRYDAKRVKEKDLVGAIQQVGFKVQAETVELKVDGMTCGGCSGKVATALTKVKGVKEQKVCHESKQATVTFDPAKVTREQIVAAIDETGFKVAQQ